MRYVIIGAGAVGGTIAGRLAEAGQQVVLVARGAHRAALAELLLGRLLGVPTPLNELLQRLANEFARERRAPGSLPLPDLIRLADAAVAFLQDSRGPRSVA
ncbi:ketopantoate reductase [Streptomyces sp. B4I13]|nr:ketopantoate reductase [Streptomyces sp. B4I13]